MEHKQDDIDSKVTELLAKSTATESALQELKLMLSKYVGGRNAVREGSPSISNSALDDQVALSHEDLREVQDVHIQPTSALPGSGQKDNRILQDVNRGGVNRKAEVDKVITSSTAAPENNTHQHGSSVPEKAKDKAAALRDSSANTKRAGTDQKGKRTSTTEEESCPTSIGGAVEGLLEASKVRVEATVTHAPPSPIPEKRKRRPATKVDAITGVSVEETGKIRCEDITGPRIAPLAGDTLKLIIFNIPGTLMDCSLLREKNPNPSVRTTLNMATRRVVFRPWLQEFFVQVLQELCCGILGK
jgi:hypothetical protein